MVALNQARRPNSRRKAQNDADRQIEAVVAVLRGRWRAPMSQATLVVALLRAMGGPLGASPNMVDIATQLGVTHQRVYQMMAALERKGVVARNQLEIRL